MPKYCANVGCGWPGAVRGPRGSALAQETPGKSQREPREAAETAQETPNSSCARRRPRLPSASPGASNTPQEAHRKKKTRRGSKGKKNTCMIFAVSRRAETAQEAPKIAQTRPARRPLRRRDGQRGPGDEPRPPDGATTEKHRAAHILMSYIFGTLPCRIHS